MKVFGKVLGTILALFLAKEFIPGVLIEVIEGKSSYFGINFTKDWQIIIFLGLILGFINAFLKPILNLISLPFKILTFGLFPLILNLVLVHGLDLILKELKFETFFSLFLTSLIILIFEALL